MLKPQATNQSMGIYFLGLIKNNMAEPNAEPAVINPAHYLYSLKGLFRLAKQD